MMLLEDYPYVAAEQECAHDDSETVDWTMAGYTSVQANSP